MYYWWRLYWDIDDEDKTSLLLGEISSGIHEYKFKIIQWSKDKNALKSWLYDVGIGFISSKEFEANRDTVMFLEDDQRLDMYILHHVH